MAEGRPAPALARTQARVCASAVLRPLPAGAHWVLRGDARIMGRAGEALGMNLATVPCRSSVRGALAALWLGPDEQLLLAPATEGPALGEVLERALTGLPHALIDVSHRQVDLEMQGPGVPWCLNVGCPLDLDLEAFPVGMCTRTVLAKTQILLWRPGAALFRVVVARSYADYVSRFLAEAARELGPEDAAIGH